MSEDGAKGVGDDRAASVAYIDPGTPDRHEPKKWVRWNAAMRDEFFDHLAGSCNVAASAAAIGLRPSQVHHRRRTNKAFAEMWEAAIEAGYQLLETRLIGYVLAGGGDTIAPDDAHALGPLHWEGAIKLFTIHKARREGRGRPCGPVPGVATREQADKVILAKLAALAARGRVAAITDQREGGDA
ncbi:hypothetical protein M9979_09150 [Sphingomonas sp. RP10(2022)]|uniref:Uncharacterized protein n=1 Tax=Sphingomonas liriopis TaxID=2949094 RepID=A0A9X2HX40_9SPHN|nr:hypothetical protein [Sphingomonas liriopis]MCP3735034.1 hypothetical protein [Sphingomonas liriopis]